MIKTRVDLFPFELHNIERVGEGLRTRKALTSLKTPTGGTVFVGGFTIESPNTTEPLHYLFEQDTGTAIVTVRVFTEEFFEISSYSLGVLARDPVLTLAVGNGQFMINGPSLSAPLYGIVGGGGPIAAVLTPSLNPDTTALQIPAGVCCSFGDRWPIAQGNVLFFNDPPLANNVDPRTYVAQNAFALPGNIYDILQGEDGALRIFTSAGVFSMPPDALGQGQSPQAFLSKMPAIETSRSRNACAAGGGAAVLQKDHVLMLVGGAVTKIPLSPYRGRRSFSQVVDIDDLRVSGELHPTPDGFIVGFRTERGFYIHVDTKAGSVSYVTSTATALNVVGTLRSRDNQPLIVLKDRVVAAAVSGANDFDGNAVRGVACGKLALRGDRPVIRRIVVGAGNAGQTIGAYLSGTTMTATTPALSGEAVIGTSLWNVAPTQLLAGRQMRSVRRTCAVRATDPHLEVRVDGGDVAVERFIDLEMGGQGPKREDKN